MPPGLRIIALVAAHNEADIIASSVGDLAAQDIATYVLDDGSTDDTVGALRPLSERGVVRIERLPTEGDPPPGDVRPFALRPIIARKEQLAQTLDADWFINHDADEFRESPWVHLTLREGIHLVDRLGYNAIDFAVLNFQPTHDHWHPHDDIRAAYPYFEFGAAHDKLQIRCWKKTSALIDLQSTAGHEARFSGRRVFPIRFLLRHYPFRGQAHATRKVFVERRPRFAEEERAHGWHVQYDTLHPGHCFIRDPRELELFDPDAVRVRLQTSNRTLEDAEASLAVRWQELDAAAASAASAIQEARELRQVLEGLRQHAAQLERIREETLNSWSWKVTAPLRAGLRAMKRLSR